MMIFFGLAAGALALLTLWMTRKAAPRPAGCC